MRATTETVLLVICAISFVVTGGSALVCYTCTNVQMDYTNQIFYKFVAGQFDVFCDDPSSGFLHSETCPSSYDYICANFNGHVTFTLPSVGTRTASVQKRGCVQVGYNTGIDSCQEIGSDVETKFVGEVLSVFTEVNNVEIDGKMCLCGTDRCDVKDDVEDDVEDDVKDDDCDDVSIGPYCLSRVVTTFYGIGFSILTLFLLSCCCCCCCCACCKSHRPGFIVNNMPASVTVVSMNQAPSNVPMMPPPYHRLEDQTDK